MDNLKSCGKSSALKKLKGFTLVEIMIVIAILAILAGMISILTSGIVRDARLEDARTKAQTVYTGLQNVLIQLEIKDKGNLLDPKTYGATGTTNDYVSLEFYMDNGNLGGSAGATVIKNGTADTGNILTYSYPNANPAADDKEKAFRDLAKYITDNLDMSFTGYVYAAIDMSDWVVDSVVFIEDYKKVTASMPITKFVPEWGTKSGTMMSASKDRVPLCTDIYQQRDIYSGKETNCLEAAGTAVGFYPFLDDVDGSTVTYTT